jgi:chromosome segregation ATPase
MPFTAEQARAINLQARAAVAGAQRDLARWRAARQQRDGADELVVKTLEHARVPAPAPATDPDSFKAELTELREQVRKQQTLITRLRGQASQAEFSQRELDKALQKDRREVTLTVAQISTIGAQTRTVLEGLRDAGIDIEDWAPTGLAS